MANDDLFNYTDRPATVICAAIHIDDGREYVHQPLNIKTGYVIAGRRHHNCFATAYAIRGRRKTDQEMDQSKSVVQGFLTSDNRFLGRIEAMNLAKAMNQTRPGCDFDRPLFSEDLY